MRGYSQPFGLTVYDNEDHPIIVEDIFSLLKFFAIILVMTKLLVSIQNVMFVIVLSVLILICFVAICYYKTSQWHATEHKLIYLLEHGCLLTIENLEKAPIKHEQCGIHNRILSKPSKRNIRMAIKAG